MVYSWFGICVEAARVRLDQLYELCTRAVVNVGCDLGGFAAGGYSPDLWARDVGDNRDQLAIFDFCLERVADGRDPNVLVEAATCVLNPSDPASMGLDLVEV